MRIPATAVLAAAVISTGVVATPAQADHGTLPPGRSVKHYTVQPGDTATGLAVRFHAWTAELVSHNHLGSSAALHVGQRIEIPVVRSAVRDGDGGSNGGGASGDRASAEPRNQPTTTPSRERVRSKVATVARRRGVDPQLALAVSWQESGWQMQHVSSAGAVGAMQVLPSTARWMEWYVDRDLRPRRLHGNAVTGVTLLGVLADNTRNRRRQVAAYYQGLGAVQEHGLYDESRPYVDNVLAIKRRLEQGQPPA
jgi:LysM repeat protein